MPIASVLRDYLDEHLLQLGDERPRVRRGGRQPVRADPLAAARGHGVEAGEARPRSRCTSADTLREPDDRRRRQREGALDYMGHANIAITLDRYGHLMPGNEDEAAGLLDAYLERSDTAPRLAALEA